jgi:hypothetical protein
MLTQRPVSRAAIPARIALFALVCLPSILPAQYFGRNKVQWEQFDWKVLKTEHFDIYYYPEEEAAVRDTARMAERWYARLRQVFERDFLERKSIILYADQSDFQQTTVVGGLIGQGTGGVTEGLRTRVVLPLTGNDEDTDHVLGHELVHVFQYDILRDPQVREGAARGQGGGYDLPLWFIEGLAEYLSLGPTSPQTAMWLRDALARDALPDLRKLSRDPRLFPYRWGHAFWAYVGGRWNDRTVGRLFTRGTTIGLELALEETLGLTDTDFSELWKAAIREAYAPVLEARQTPKTLGARLLPKEEETTDTYIAPVISPDGSEVIFLATRSLFTFDLYVADARTGEIQRKLISEDGDPHFDALRFLDSAGTWSPDGQRFAFVTLARGDNEIEVMDVRSRHIERRYPVADVGSIWNLSWSPDGRTLAFSGASGGISDLYLLDVASGQVRKLTDDRFADLQPEWSPDGRSLAFVSDRGLGNDLTQLVQGPMSIWLLDVESRQMRELTPGDKEAGDRINPQFGPEGRDLYFLSDRAGVTDVYRMDVASGQLFRVTHLTTGATGITRLSPALSVSESTGRVMFSVFNDAVYHIQALDPAQARGEPVIPDPVSYTRAATLPPARERAAGLVAQYLAEPQQLEAARTGVETDEYHPSLQLDFVGPAVGVGVSTFGTSFGGDITAYFSDVLNQREVGFTLYGGSGSTLSEFGAEAYYLNQATRLQWGGAGGHVPYISAFTSARNEIIDVDGQQVQARVIEQIRQTVTQDQAALISRYPLSTTRRLEASVGYTRLDYKAELFRVAVVGNTIVEDSQRDLPAPGSLSFAQGSFAYVADTSYFGFTSPVRGHRFRLEVAPTFGDLEYQSLLADYRRYFFLRPVTLALRGLHLGRYGTDAESDRLTQLYVGRPTLVRGYEIGDIGLSECTPVPGDPQACPEFDRLVGSRLAVANLELRLPLLGTRGYGIFNAPFLPTELSAFVDAGVAWTADQTPRVRFETRSIDRIPVVSAGISARILLGGFAVLQFYYAKPFQRPDENWVTGFVIAPGW